MKFNLQLILIFSITIFLVAGCAQTEFMSQNDTVPQIKKSSKDTISIEYLCNRFDLGVQEKKGRYLRLRNSGNRVFIFSGVDGDVYVNGDKIESKGGYLQARGTYYIPFETESMITSMLGEKAKTVKRMKPVKRERFSGTRVVIDPGHGGRDPGAVSVLGIYEKTVNLDVANKLARYLKNQGIDVIMTRSGDSHLSLDQRVRIGNRNDPDLFISIHADSCETASVRGYTVYICKSASKSSVSAAGIVENAMRSSNLKSRGVRKADYKVLVSTKCPAILVELGYLSNRKEAALLSDSSFREDLAQRLADAVCQYCRY